MDKKMVLDLLIKLKNDEDTKFLKTKQDLGDFLFKNTSYMEHEQLYEDADILADEILNMIEMMKEK